MRTTEGKPVLGTRWTGERALADALAGALSAQDRVVRATHGFHTYPAGLNPDAARDLLRLFPGHSVLDPFCGGGTVLVEAMLAGRRAVGSDLSEVATLVAWARTRRTDEAGRTRLRVMARKLTERAQHATKPPPASVVRRVGDWYEPHVLAELEAIREGVVECEEEPQVRDLLWAAFSSILVKVSLRRSDTAMTKVAEARPAGTTAILFHKRVRELARQLAALEALCPSGTTSAEVGCADARLPGDGSFELVLTSPPYPAVYDYLPIQDLREAWLGLRLTAGDEIGARRHWLEDERAAVGRWREDTRLWMTSIARRLDPAGRIVIVIGDGLVRSGQVDALSGTLEAAQRAGLRAVCTASLARPDHARRSTRWEHVIVLRLGGDKSARVPTKGST